MDMTHKFPATQYCGYSERAFFTSDACAHCADRDEFLRLQRIRQRSLAIIGRRTGSRGFRP